MTLIQVQASSPLCLLSASRGRCARHEFSDPLGQQRISSWHATSQACKRQRSVRMLVRAGDVIADWIEANLPEAGPVTGTTSLGSSDWSSFQRLQTASGQRFFVKQARGHAAEAMFNGEALGLTAMYGGGSSGSGSCIIMEFLELGRSTDQGQLGRLLAQMHLAAPKDTNAASGRFGFPVDNTIGGTSQPNGWMDDWVQFFGERRLRHQLKLAGRSDLDAMGNKLIANLDSFFEGIEVRPSVLHGDLWSGNIGSVEGQPSIFDPAVYYGHSEAEFGMAWCAGFNGSFWSAYNEVIPKAPGFDDRHAIYELYHYLNHYNMFGSGYLGQCQTILKRLTKNM